MILGLRPEGKCLSYVSAPAYRYSYITEYYGCRAWSEYSQLQSRAIQLAPLRNETRAVFILLRLGMPFAGHSLHLRCVHFLSTLCLVERFSENRICCRAEISFVQLRQLQSNGAVLLPQEREGDTIFRTYCEISNYLWMRPRIFRAPYTRWSLD